MQETKGEAFLNLTQRQTMAVFNHRWHRNKAQWRARLVSQGGNGQIEARERKRRRRTGMKTITCQLEHCSSATVRSARTRSRRDTCLISRRRSTCSCFSIPQRLSSSWLNGYLQAQIRSKVRRSSSLILSSSRMESRTSLLRLTKKVVWSR